MTTGIFVTVLGGAVTACGGPAAGSARSETTVAAAPTVRREVGPVNARGEREVVVRVGRAGGTLELASGARLEIPAGALEDEVELTFTTVPSVTWDASTKRPLGPSLEVRPAIAAARGALRLSAPAQTIPDGFESSDLGIGVEEETEGRVLSVATSTRWQFWPATVREGRFVAELPALHGHRVQFGVSR